MNNNVINAKGELDYDLKNDILFFKAKNREYERSIESENLVIDIDNEGLITGLQIMEASEFLELNKPDLLKIPKWRFTALIKNNKIMIRLKFSIEKRNRIIEKSPIIIKELKEKLPDSELVCSIV